MLRDTMSVLGIYLDNKLLAYCNADVDLENNANSIYISELSLVNPVSNVVFLSIIRAIEAYFIRGIQTEYLSFLLPYNDAYEAARSDNLQQARGFRKALLY